MTRLGSKHCVLDRQAATCKLPSARKVTFAIEKSLDLFPPLNLFFPIPNLISLFWGQFVAHDTSQGQTKGKSTGSPSNAACAANGRNLPAELVPPNVRGIQIDCNDPFYKNFGVRCLDLIEFRTLDEECTVKKPEFVSI